MIKRKEILAFFLLFPHLLFSYEKITFDDLENFLGKEVEIRGFLAQIKDEWILSSEPNLKSCCLGKPKNIHLKSDYPLQKTWKVVTIKGTLSKDDHYTISIPH